MGALPTGALVQKLAEIEALAKGVPGLPANGPQTLAGAKCYAKKESFLADKEYEVCIEVGIPTCKTDRGNLRRAFRSVLSYAVALAVGSTTILRTRPVMQGASLVAHCIDFPPTGALQPRRAPPGLTTPIVLTYVDNIGQSPAPANAVVVAPPTSAPKAVTATDPVLAQRPQIATCLKDNVNVHFGPGGFAEIRPTPCLDCGVIVPGRLSSASPAAQFNKYAPTRNVMYLQVHPIAPGARDSVQEMQLLDHIAGQCDRHEENFFVDSRGAYGIDLDMAWGNRVDPYGGDRCKLLPAAPYVAPDVLKRFDILKNGGLTQIIKAVGRVMQVPAPEVDAVATAAEARFKTVIAAVPTVASYTDQNSLFARTNTRAQMCSQFKVTPTGAANGQQRAGNQLGARGAVPPLPPVVPPGGQGGNGALPPVVPPVGGLGAVPSRTGPRNDMLARGRG